MEAPARESQGPLPAPFPLCQPLLHAWRDSGMILVLNATGGQGSPHHQPVLQHLLSFLQLISTPEMAPDPTG